MGRKKAATPARASGNDKGANGAVPGDDAQANTLTEKAPGNSRKCTVAELSLSPVVGGVLTSRAFTAGIAEVVELTESLAVMRDKACKVQAGDLSEAEIMLLAQAVTLDTIFNTLARRAATTMGTHFDATDTYLRLALKAQGQCRTTLETLAEIKNPRPVAFVKQANIAHGLQQVNNGVATECTLAHAGNNIMPSNELLDGNNGERLDTRTQSAPGAANQQLAPMGKVDGAAQ
jgi:hypothetical protein